MRMAHKSSKRNAVSLFRDVSGNDPGESAEADTACQRSECRRLYTRLVRRAASIQLSSCDCCARRSGFGFRKSGSQRRCCLDAKYKVTGNWLPLQVTAGPSCAHAHGRSLASIAQETNFGPQWRAFKVDRMLQEVGRLERRLLYWL